MHDGSFGPGPPYYNSARVLDRAAKAHASRPSLTYAEQTWSVAQTAHATRQLAQLLAAIGVGSGDRVMLISHNSPYHLLLHVACARLGAIFVPVSFRLSRKEVQPILDEIAPRVLVVEPEIGNEGTFETTFSLTQFVIDDDPLRPTFTPAISAGYLALGAGMGGFSGDFRTVVSDGSTALNSREYPEGPAAILLTSGSTGNSKAVELTHANLWWGSQNFREGFEYAPRDVELVAAPLSHIGGFNGTTLDLFTRGGHVIIQRTFDPGEVLETLQSFSVAIMFAVPTMYRAMVDHPDFETANLRSFRLPLIGGASVPESLLEKLQAKGLNPINVWGMTETSASGFCLSGDLSQSHRGAIGRPFAHVEARVVDPETGTDVVVPEAGMSDAGELLVRGPSVVGEYWHNSDETRANFTDDWLQTGDMVRLDSDGITWAVGRRHNRINTGGEKVMPEEVERVILNYPGVAAGIVFGSPDETWGEVVTAGLVMDDGAALPTVEDLRAFGEGEIARFKLPRKVVELDGVPVNANGKPDRSGLSA